AVLRAPQRLGRPGGRGPELLGRALARVPHPAARGRDMARGAQLGLAGVRRQRGREPGPGPRRAAAPARPRALRAPVGAAAGRPDPGPGASAGLTPRDPPDRSVRTGGSPGACGPGPRAGRWARPPRTARADARARRPSSPGPRPAAAR